MTYYDDWEEEPWEPSKAEEIANEACDKLREAVKEEIKQEIEGLKKELEDLKEIKSNWEKLRTEAERAKADAARRAEQAEREAKQNRLETILEGLTKPVYAIEYGFIDAFPKCERCNEAGLLFFKSPITGNTFKERCPCRATKRFYEVHSPASARYYHLSRGEESFCFDFARDDEYNRYKDRLEINKNLYDGRPFEEIEYPRSIYFENREDAQKYADYLNAKEDEKLENTRKLIESMPVFPEGETPVGIAVNGETEENE